MVCLIMHLHHRIYGLFAMFTMFMSINTKSSKCSCLPFCHHAPRKPNPCPTVRHCPIMDASIWLPCILLVLSEIQAAWHLTWQQNNAKPKFFYFPDLDCWITTINKTLTCGQHAGTFSHFCGPSKPPFNPSPAMMSVKQGALQAPQQAVFDSNFHKVLTNSGTSTHMWNCQCDFISHWMLTQEEQMCDKVLDISSTTVLPLGSGTILTEKYP